MSISYEEEPDAFKRCKYLATTLKNAFCKCHSIRGLTMPYSSSPEPEESTTDFDQEEEIFVSAVMSKYMESKSKRECSNIGLKDSSFYSNYSWALSPKAVMMKRNHENDGDEFFSAGSHISSSSAGDSFDGDDEAAYVSAKTCFSLCSPSSTNINIDHFRLDLFGMRQRSIILEFIHCEGWPFGLCRKALLLPPLPKSPADSWSWRKTAKIINHSHVIQYHARICHDEI